MHAKISLSLSDAIRQWAANLINQKPSLCGEIDNIGFSESLYLILTVLEKWECPFFLLRGEVNGKEECVLVDRSGLGDQVQQMLENEGTMSISDVTKNGGCTFDLCKNEDGNGEDYSFLAAAWGEHEHTAEDIGLIRDDTIMFRGN